MVSGRQYVPHSMQKLSLFVSVRYMSYNVKLNFVRKWK